LIIKKKINLNIFTPIEGHPPPLPLIKSKHLGEGCGNGTNIQYSKNIPLKLKKQIRGIFEWVNILN